MNTRCQFLDHLPAFNYNLGVGEYLKNSQGEQVRTDTRTLGSALMEAMLKEVSDFCDPAIKENWSINPHQQLIYDMSSIDLITLHADKLSAADRTKFTKIGVKVPTMMEMHTRDILDKYLSKALGVELKDRRLKQIDEANYVLTLDYTLKMLNIHERYRCGVPVIIEGETGVGKTALVQMLSVLWNHSLLSSWSTEKGRIRDLLTRRIGDLSEDSCENYGATAKLLQAVYYAQLKSTFYKLNIHADVIMNKVQPCYSRAAYVAYLAPDIDVVRPRVGELQFLEQPRQVLLAQCAFHDHCQEIQICTNWWKAIHLFCKKIVFWTHLDGDPEELPLATCRVNELLVPSTSVYAFLPQMQWVFQCWATSTPRFKNARGPSFTTGYCKVNMLDGCVVQLHLTNLSWSIHLEGPASQLTFQFFEIP
eukprot:Em0018g953a